MKNKILIVDDDPSLLRLVSFELEREGYSTITLDRPQDAIRRIAEETPAVVILDHQMPEITGPEILEQARELFPSIPFIMLTSHSDVDKVVECMRLGAHDFVQKPFDRNRLLTSVRNAERQRAMQARIDQLSEALRASDGFDSILGQAKSLERSLTLLKRATGSSVSVLICGESGTGKELAARAVHAQSARRASPFIAVNCGAIPENLIESELFGHEKGAFTGADRARAGFFEQADGGTIFLDEIGELPLELQVKLLRVLQERAVRRLGSNKPIAIDARVISATHVDLLEAMKAGLFREDLYYRLAVFPVTLPPLRERENDRLVLAEVFLDRFAEEHGRSALRLGKRARDAVLAYDWPGNIRELQNAMQRAALLTDADEITLSALPEVVVGALEEPQIDALLSASARVERGRRPLLSADEDRLETVDDIRPFADEERDLILRALRLTGWNIQEAATRLKLGRATIYRKIERYDLAPSPEAMR